MRPLDGSPVVREIVFEKGNCARRYVHLDGNEIRNITLTTSVRWYAVRLDRRHAQKAEARSET